MIKIMIEVYFSIALGFKPQVIESLMAITQQNLPDFNN
jgi:hypothetical protein